MDTYHSPTAITSERASKLQGTLQLPYSTTKVPRPCVATTRNPPTYKPTKLNSLPPQKIGRNPAERAMATTTITTTHNTQRTTKNNLTRTRHRLCGIANAPSPPSQLLEGRQQGQRVLEPELGDPPHAVEVPARPDEAGDGLVHRDGLRVSKKNK